MYAACMKKRLLTLLPALIMTGLIAWASSQTFSAENTGGLLYLLLAWAFPGFSAETLAGLNTLLRKAGHVTAYGLLALSWLGALQSSFRQRASAREIFFALLIALALASWDEWNQSLIPSRTGTAWDLCWDMGGALLFLCLQFWFSGFYSQRKT
ncbi:hypothetical protein COW36_11250 [bacterium (Candidatus Blackallbacteria) CG17_big_fil_post_rev_8_21_14_2_50_48_46]|uniref:Uncharacterized protein n=1 Tax=bacterium (Candidatus Blackallbacteria) CG17_big_fil_post_rev_8_21_14_2_50_48_46 TaxID=2014261 RepID=A0A2M7G4Y8_9BACT|nr:MAG: hypothetical protein COW64_18345 [bacterium (Candidatus Blackallbacteria) CG18_big_fil_WC_8_21_14_2_50_49_26]PIW16851.1 MAG: hypothetical protein COW36_11250 [bacterium (Candidatus Blackallbacteria) CG17_big_fil_post_rev_8_21_14_2_50_48_46]PIW48048.1 MAG: hypothetical protein COW20_10965 [bacterium (Candidatus Blackallbacteria) CG13_big_fil_rev_8_21_14_2_50_49_14]